MFHSFRSLVGIWQDECKYEMHLIYSLLSFRGFFLNMCPDSRNFPSLCFFFKSLYVKSKMFSPRHLPAKFVYWEAVSGSSAWHHASWSYLHTELSLYRIQIIVAFPIPTPLLHVPCAIQKQCGFPTFRKTCL